MPTTSRDAATIDAPRRTRDAAGPRAGTSAESDRLAAWLAREADYYRAVRRAARPAQGKAPLDR